MCCDCSDCGTMEDKYEPPAPKPDEPDPTDGTDPLPGPTNPTNPPNKPGPSRPERDKPNNGTIEGNPSNQTDPIQGGRRKRIRRLWCANGYDLAVFPNGVVRGTKSPKNKYGLLEFEAAGLDGQLRIRGTHTGFYVTMTPKGRVHGQPLAQNRGTIWLETKLGTGQAYLSLLSLDYAHHGYYLALKKNGKAKPGPKTTYPYPQKAVSFIYRTVAEEYP